MGAKKGKKKKEEIKEKPLEGQDEEDYNKSLCNILCEKVKALSLEVEKKQQEEDSMKQQVEQMKKRFGRGMQI